MSIILYYYFLLYQMPSCQTIAAKVLHSYSLLFLFRVAENDENFLDHLQVKDDKTVSDEQGSRGLQNITNKMASMKFCNESALNSKWSKFSGSAIREQDVDSWHVGKIKASDLPPEPCNTSTKSDVIPKHALAQPPSGAIEMNASPCPLLELERHSYTYTRYVHAGPRKMNEGTGEMRQRILRAVEDPERDFLEIQVLVELQKIHNCHVRLMSLACILLVKMKYLSCNMFYKLKGHRHVLFISYQILSFQLNVLYVRPRC
jgi:hypothetical protein